MKVGVIILIFISICSSCDNNDVKISHSLREGTYAGIFFRAFPQEQYKAAHVALTFNSGQFTGASNVMKYPAICSGTYSVAGATIRFKNECIWTAEFDWTHILSGDFIIKSEGDSLEILRTTGSQKDIYKLRLQ